MSTTVLASRYVCGRLEELVALPSRPHHAYIVRINGQVPDARRKLTLAAAQAWYDRATRTYADRPARAALSQEAAP